MELGGLHVTPLPLIHSKLTNGYLIQAPGKALAYLTDTVGLPPETTRYLQQVTLDLLVLIAACRRSHRHRVIITICPARRRSSNACSHGVRC